MDDVLESALRPVGGRRKCLQNACTNLVYRLVLSHHFVQKDATDILI